MSRGAKAKARARSPRRTARRLPRLVERLCPVFRLARIVASEIVLIKLGELDCCNATCRPSVGECALTHRPPPSRTCRCSAHGGAIAQVLRRFFDIRLRGMRRLAWWLTTSRRQPDRTNRRRKKNRTGRHISERPAIMMSRDAISSAKTGHRRTTSFLALRLWPVPARPCHALGVQSPPVAGAALRRLTFDGLFVIRYEVSGCQ
jgi:hypothetical protein